MVAFRVRVPWDQVRRLTAFSLRLRKSGLCCDQGQGEMNRVIFVCLFVCANYFLYLTLKH